MFELEISDIFEAVKLSQEWATHTISLVDPGIEDCDGIVQNKFWTPEFGVQDLSWTSR